MLWVACEACLVKKNIWCQTASTVFSKINAVSPSVRFVLANSQSLSSSSSLMLVSFAIVAFMLRSLKKRTIKISDPWVSKCSHSHRRLANLSRGLYKHRRHFRFGNSASKGLFSDSVCIMTNSLEHVNLMACDTMSSALSRHTKRSAMHPRMSLQKFQRIEIGFLKRHKFNPRGFL